MCMLCFVCVCVCVCKCMCMYVRVRVWRMTAVHRWLPSAARCMGTALDQERIRGYERGGKFGRGHPACGPCASWKPLLVVARTGAHLHTLINSQTYIRVAISTPANKKIWTKRDTSQVRLTPGQLELVCGSLSIAPSRSLSRSTIGMGTLQSRWTRAYAVGRV